MNLKHLALFLEIVEKGSLAAAGRELGLSASTVSEKLAALEVHYGTTLLNRTTRAIHLTDEGRMVVDGARKVLEEAAELESRVRLGTQTLSGSIRVSATMDLGRAIIAPLIDRFLATHPKVCIELLLSDGYVNVVDDGLDLAVRFGNLEDSTLRVRRLGAFRRVVCASPSYIAEHGEPQSPADLKCHNCLVMRFGQHLDNVWRFQNGQKETVRGNRIANDGSQVHAWCLNGHGVALKSELDVVGEIERGVLVQLLPDYPTEPRPLQMLFPPRLAQPRRVQALAESLVAAFRRS